MIKLINKYLLTLLLLFNFTAVKAQFDINASTAILQDTLSGEILFEKEADRSIYPASMTKIMTTIIAFDLLKNGDLKLNDKFLISEKAWRLAKPGNSSMFIMLNDEITIENLLKGIIIVSGNDACVALAEGIAGSEEAFAMLMTEKAKEIGMLNTNFTNASGLNDPNNYSTVRDILIMSNYLIKNFPEYYDYFRENEFTWNRTGGDSITQPNTNSLLKKNKYVDGIKTGYLAVEKYSLAASLEKNGRRLTSVGSGFSTKSKRSSESNKLLNYGLTKFDTIQIIKKKETIDELTVWLGKKDTVEVYVDEDFYKTIPKYQSLNKKKYIKVKIDYFGPIKAPINYSEKVGSLKVFYEGSLINEFDLLAKENINQINIFYRIIRSINYLIWGDV